MSERREVVLLLGATGFIGGALRGELARAGYDVVCGIRDPAAVQGCRGIAVDFSRDFDDGAWLSRLAGIDYVVNAVGILRETPRSTFDALHVKAPQALFRASVAAGVRKIIQISALGADANAASAYHRSKKLADDALAELPVPWVIVQPSLVFGESGASAALFAKLAALPWIPVPGKGDQAIQPVHVDDLAEAIVRLLRSSEFDRSRIAAVGPQPLTLRQYLAALRDALELERAHFVRVPMFLVRAAASIGEKLPGALLDRESLGMLLRGNVASANDFTRLLGRSPRATRSFIDPAQAPALVREAQLAWLLPLVRYSIAFVWIVTGIVSAGVYPVEESYALLARVGLTGIAATVALYGAALLDIAFGIGCIALKQRKWLWRAQMALIVSYTGIISFRLPEFWLHPYGPLTKNLPMLAAILLLHELEKRERVTK